MQNTLREKIIEKLILFKAGNLTNEERYADQILSLIIESLPSKGNDLYCKNVYPPQSKWKEGWDDYREEVIKMLKGV